MKHESRRCRVCGSAELEPITTLPNYPMVAGPVTRVPKTVRICSLEVGFCPNCGTCVSPNIDTDELPYDDDYTSSGIAYGSVKSVDKQTDRFIEFIGRADKAQGSKVLEIGCYDGTLMELLERRYKFNMLGCEPCPALAEEARGKGYLVHTHTFDATAYSELDMIVARNVLEHIPSPSQFVAGIASALKWNGTLVLEVPAGEHYICNGILGTIVPQHSCYFGADSLGRLLGNRFMAITEKESKATIHALASLPQFIEPSDIVEGDITDITQLRTGERIRQTRYSLVRRATENEKVDIFGANTCALELIAAGAVKAEQIDKVYDDDPRKWGRYLVNTDLIVQPRSALGKGKQRKVIVCSYTHRRSIADYIKEQNGIAITLYGGDE